MTPEQERILVWAEAARRDLPWRRTRDPWAILVAEVMLQQTQVDRVVPRWHGFLERWPDTVSCSAAPLSDLLAHWQGLGYPRRARYLHAAAIAVETEHGGRFPDELDTLLALDGVGPYTARAVLAFAHERDVAVLDTNVGRILARRAGRPLRPVEAQRIADSLVPAERGWAWNQGMLDLGAQLCRPQGPRCAECPVRPECAWGDAERAGDDPAKGSAAVSRPQARYEGSARQARGRLLAALGAGPVAPAAVPSIVGWSARADATTASDEIIDSLCRDGLVARDRDGRLVLAGR